MLCPQEYLPHLIRRIQQHDVGLLPCGKRTDVLVHAQRTRRVQRTHAEDLRLRQPDLVPEVPRRLIHAQLAAEQISVHDVHIRIILCACAGVRHRDHAVKADRL